MTPKGANWLWAWAWALAIPISTTHAKEAQRFIDWATSQEYIHLVARENGWARVPTGTRHSTYQNPNFLSVAPFAKAELAAIQSADPDDSTLEPSPYVGVQFAAIPEFQGIGVAVGRQISAVLTGEKSVEEALRKSQRLTDREMRISHYCYCCRCWDGR